MVDLATVCKTCRVAPLNEVKRHFGQEEWDLIVVESETDKIQQPGVFYGDLCALIKPGGRLITTAAQGLLPIIEGTLARNGFVRANSRKEYYFAFDKQMQLPK